MAEARHGDLDARYGSFEAYRVMDQHEPCANCEHEQHEHDEDDHCTRCACQEFQYGEERRF